MCITSRLCHITQVTGGHTDHDLAWGHIANDHSPSSHHGAITHDDTLTHRGPDADMRADTRTHTSCKDRTRGNVGVRTNMAIVIHNCPRIHNDIITQMCVGIEDSPSHNGYTAVEVYRGRHDSPRVHRINHDKASRAHLLVDPPPQGIIPHTANANKRRSHTLRAKMLQLFVPAHHRYPCDRLPHQARINKSDYLIAAILAQDVHQDFGVPTRSHTNHWDHRHTS